MTEIAKQFQLMLIELHIARTVVLVAFLTHTHTHPKFNLI